MIVSDHEPLKIELINEKDKADYSSKPTLYVLIDKEPKIIIGLEINTY